ncbi:MAG TPA: amidohydrolase family protein [Solirubrobacter sp.]
MIVDAHVHLWDPGVLDYPWLPDALRFAHTSFEGRAVVVEADAVGDELGWLESLPGVEAIVAHAPLEKPCDLAALAARPLVRGVRRLLQGEPDAVFDAVRPNVRALAEHGLPFDACITQDQMHKLIALVGACEETMFVLDHCGKPHALDPWRGQLSELASRENVVCKLSGLTTEVADPRPYLEHALDVFGPERCLFGSDWPVASLATTYEHWLETVSGLLGEGERQTVLAATAERVYRLSAVTNQEER